MTIRFPRAAELPEFDLYMDQVVSIINRYLYPISFDGDENYLITSAMINNYVKQHMIHAPEKKRYDRKHLMLFLCVSMLKRILSVSEIIEVTGIVLRKIPAEQAFDTFTAYLETTMDAVMNGHNEGEPTLPDGVDDPDALRVIASIARAFSNKYYAQTILRQAKAEAAPGEEGKDKKKRA